MQQCKIMLLKIHYRFVHYNKSLGINNSAYILCAILALVFAALVNSRNKYGRLMPAETVCIDACTCSVHVMYMHKKGSNMSIHNQLACRGTKFSLIAYLSTLQPCTSVYTCNGAFDIYIITT